MHNSHGHSIGGYEAVEYQAPDLNTLLVKLIEMKKNHTGRSLIGYCNALGNHRGEALNKLMCNDIESLVAIFNHIFDKKYEVRNNVYASVGGVPVNNKQEEWKLKINWEGK